MAPGGADPAPSTPTAYVWTYRVRPEWRDRFRAAYGPAGAWAEFFRGSPAYLRTDLLENADGFVTIDWFADPDSRGALVAAHQADYAALDREWSQATTDETFIGAFAAVPGAPAA